MIGRCRAHRFGTMHAFPATPSRPVRLKFVVRSTKQVGIGCRRERVDWGLGARRAGKPLQADLHAVHGRKPHRLGSLPELNESVEPVMVGHGQRLILQPYRLLYERLRVRSSIEKAEVGVTVQFGVSHESFRQTRSILSNICSICFAVGPE